MTTPTTALTIGNVIPLTQNAVYTAPARFVKFQSSAVVQVSMDNSTFVDVAASTTGMDLIAPYVKCTGVTTCVAICKAY